MADLKKLGLHGEAHAMTLLKKRGDKLVARNFTCPQGEVDLITLDKDTLVFTEVRARTPQGYGNPAESVTRGKQQRIKRAANWFVVQKFKGAQLPSCRFDVIWIVAKDDVIVESGIIAGAFC